MIDADNPWVSTMLGKICQINPSRPQLADLSDETSVLFVPMAAVDDVTGEITALEHRALGEVRAKSFRTFAPDDVIFAKITPCMENGKSAVVPEIASGIGFGSTEFHVLRPNASVNPRFIWHYVRQESFRQSAKGQMTGSVGQARVPATYLENFPISLPPEATQNSIVSFLDNAMALGRSATAHLGSAYRVIERFRQAVLATACSGRLSEDWRNTHPAAQTVEYALTQVKSKRVVREVFNDFPMPDVPESYVISTVGQASVLLEYGTSKRADASSDGLPILRMGNIQNGHLELDDLKYAYMDSEIKRLILHDGDLLFNRTNSPELVGKSAVFHEGKPMTFASYLIRVRFAPDVADPDFVNYWINSAWGKAWARHVKTDGVSQSNINGSKLAAMPIPLPPIDEQREIVRRGSQMLQLAETLLKRIDVATHAVERSSQAVLAKAFRGELSAIASEGQNIELSV